PLGQSRIIDFGDGNRPWSVKIVGVVGNVKHFGLDDLPIPTIYFPLDQIWPSAIPILTAGMTVMVKTPADPLEMADEVRRGVASIDADVATSAPTTMSQILASTLGPRKFNTQVME